MKVVSDHTIIFNKIEKYGSNVVYYSIVLTSILCVGLFMYYNPISPDINSSLGLPATTLLAISGFIIYPIRNTTKERPTAIAVNVVVFAIAFIFAMDGLSALDGANILQHAKILEFYFSQMQYVMILAIMIGVFRFKEWFK